MYRLLQKTRAQLQLLAGHDIRSKTIQATYWDQKPLFIEIQANEKGESKSNMTKHYTVDYTVIKYLQRETRIYSHCIKHKIDRGYVISST